MQMQAGELRGSRARRPDRHRVERHARSRSRISTTTRRPIRINAIGGSGALDGLRDRTRGSTAATREIDVDDRRSRRRSRSTTRATSRCDVTLPPTAATSSTRSRPTARSDRARRTARGRRRPSNEQRATGAVDGGGPTITLRIVARRRSRSATTPAATSSAAAQLHRAVRNVDVCTVEARAADSALSDCQASAVSRREVPLCSPPLRSSKPRSTA